MTIDLMATDRAMDQDPISALRKHVKPQVSLVFRHCSSHQNMILPRGCRAGVIVMGITNNTVYNYAYIITD